MTTLPIDTQDATVFDFLRRRGVYQTEAQIAKALDCPIERVKDSLAQLEGFGMVQRHGTQMDQWTLANVLDDALETVEKFEKFNKGKGPQEVQTSFYESSTEIYEEVIIKGIPHFAAYDYSNDTLEFKGQLNEGDRIITPIVGDEIDKKVVLLPTGVEEYGDIKKLAYEIRQHINEYLDITKEYQNIASWYILLSWVYDRVNTVPYLRAQGDTGCGKSRFLDVIGRLCYKSLILSGSVTAAPMFRMIDKWHGTLVIDEADLKKSDEKNEVIKILNCGFEKNRSVMRCRKDNPEKLDFFDVYGTKVFATRRDFNDVALEARCFTEIMRETAKDIPHQLPKKFFDAEEVLRNKLLMFRLKNWHKIDTDEIFKINLGDVEPRLKQIGSSFAVLFANVDGMGRDFNVFIEKHQRELIEQRQQKPEGLVVNAIGKLVPTTNVTTVTNVTENYLRITPGTISEELKENYNVDYNPRYVASLLKTLGLKTNSVKDSGKTYRYIVRDEPTLKALERRYGVTIVTEVTPVTVDPIEDFTDQRERLISLYNEVKKHKEGVQDKELADFYQLNKLPIDVLESDLNTLKRDGQIYEPKNNIWRVVE